ncbi:MAG: potassium transporter TrkG [Spirochaetales bacterium]|nr:potassium transporter TrkG [Spirochaetales bacterium]
MKGFARSESVIIFSYFIFMILLGSLLLSLPSSWKGEDDLAYSDALFTSVSAVCVTGLAVVDTASYTKSGQIILLCLIQLGGLGIVTFSTLFLIIPGLRMSMNRSQILLDFNPEKGRRDPRRIIRIIILYTLAIEGIGAFILSRLFRARGVPEPVFTGIFHGISAFCNAGFSRFSNSLEDFALDLPVNLTIMGLIITGGLGFMVIRDLTRRVFVPGHRLRYHTKLMVIATGALILGGALFFFITEGSGVFALYEGHRTTPGERVLLAFFQSITERTAGFNSIPQGEISLPGQVFSLMLMIIGGGSGSTAGGIKVTTALLIFFVMTNNLNTRGEVRFFKRRIPAELIARAGLFFLKAMGFLFVTLLALLVTERNNPQVAGNLTALIFETFSALGTVGLSHGITPLLTTTGKAVIIITMFAGRVGLFTMILPRRDRQKERHIDWPTGEVLIG